MAKGKLAWSLAIIIGGCWIASQIGLDWVPTTDGSKIKVVATWQGASPQALEKHVGSPLSQAIEAIPGTRSVETTVGGGEWVARIEIVPNVRKERYLAELGERIAIARRSCPQGATVDLAHQRIDSLGSLEGFMILRVTSPGPVSEAHAIAEDLAVARLLRLRGVADIKVSGGTQKELRALTLRASQTPTKTPAADLGLYLKRVLRYDNYGSTLDSSARLIPLVNTVDTRDISNLGNPRVSGKPSIFGSTPWFASFASLRLADAPPRSLSRVDRNAIVSLTLDRDPHVSILRASKDVRQTVEEIRKSLPPGSDLLIVDDRSEEVREQLQDLAVRGALGTLLLIGILAGMLRSLRAVALVLFAVAVALAGAIILFEPLGLTFNVLTLAGLVLLFGLLVDNAVIVVERFQGELATQRGTSMAAARRAVRGVGLPLLGGTLSTCAVFLPMVYLSGELRSLFASFAMLSALTLGFSLLTSLVLVPDLGWKLSRERRPNTTDRRRLTRLLLLPYRLGGRFSMACFLLVLLTIGLPTPWLPDRLEEPSEGWQNSEDRDRALRYNRSVGGDDFRRARLWLDPLLGGVTRPFLDKVELGKRWDFPERPEINVWLKLPAGSGIQRVDERIRPFEQEAEASPAVKRTLVNVSRRVARMTVLFHDQAMETNEPYLLRERLIS
ncbi:MAG: efflux RND transporter permease subunit, partial [Actinomycetota bacterium]